MMWNFTEEEHWGRKEVRHWAQTQVPDGWHRHYPVAPAHGGKHNQGNMPTNTNCGGDKNGS